MGSVDDDRVDRYLPLTEARAILERVFTLSPDDHRTGGPARYWKIEETGGRLGLITPLTGNFCEGCNRVRLTATGKLYICFGQNEQVDLRELVGRNDDDDLLDAEFDGQMAVKQSAHVCCNSTGAEPAVSPHRRVTGG